MKAKRKNIMTSFPWFFFMMLFPHLDRGRFGRKTQLLSLPFSPAQNFACTLGSKKPGNKTAAAARLAAEADKANSALG